MRFIVLSKSTAMKHFLLTIFVCFFVLFVFAQPPTWSRANVSAIPQAAWKGRALPQKFEVFQLNGTAMAARLNQAPSEKSISASRSGQRIELPDADGQLHTFSIVTAPVAAPGLLSKMNGCMTSKESGPVDREGFVCLFKLMNICF